MGYVKVGTIPLKDIKILRRLINGANWKIQIADDRNFRTHFPHLPIIDSISKLGKLKNCFALSIPPGGMVHKHTDTDLNSYHIPLITNDKATSYMEDEAFHLEVGNVYKANRKVEHYSVNKGESDRVHLIVSIDL